MRIWTLAAGLALSLTLGCSSDSSSSNGDTTTTSEPDVADSDVVGGTENEHPFWSGVLWEDFIPAPEKSATYTVQTVGQQQKSLAAYVEQGVPFEGSEWTRLVAGELEPSHDGAAIYIDASTPWEVRVKGVETYDSGYADGPAIREFFAEPMVIPIQSAAGTTHTVSTTLQSTLYGAAENFDITYAITIASYDAEITVPFGTLTGCVHVQVQISGDLGEFPVELYVHPEQHIVKWTDAPGFLLLELESAWQ